jgi:DNA-binding response OmpR family regulator
MPQKILLIDDDVDVVDILEVKLRNSGYIVTSANSGLEGLNKVYQESPHLIILDLMLPGLDGFSISRILKFDERYKHIPIIMLTGRTDHKSINLGLKVGADKYMTKPFDPNEVLTEVKKFLESSITK